MTRFFLIVGIFVCMACQSDPLDPAAIASGNFVPEPVYAINPGIPPPVISLPNGAYKYGFLVNLSQKVPLDKAILEYSWNDSNLWYDGSSFSVEPGKLFARTRVGDEVSAVAQADYKVLFERVLIIGNSITHHPPKPEIGWTGDWGMAASAPEKDYFHLLSQQLKSLNPTISIQQINGVPFESEFWKFDFNQWKDAANVKPDLLILRFAENVNNSSVDAYNFEQAYLALIDYFQKASPTMKVLCTNSFWEGQYRANEVIKKVAKQRRLALANLNVLWTDRANAAWGLFQKSDVAAHPSDKGMKNIADIIYQQIEP